MKRVRIIADRDPENPRDWCNAGRMICWHGRYHLGDEHNYDCDNYRFELACEADASLEDEVIRLENDVYNALHDRYVRDNEDWDCDDAHEYAYGAVSRKVAKLIDKALERVVMLPLYLYDHSGITMSTGPFSCPWDSGCVGVIVCDAEALEREFAGDRDKAEACLRAEVEVYDQYLTGDVYGFIVEERDDDGCECCDREFDWEHVDSCWGFFGSDPRENGMADHLGCDDLVALAADAEVEFTRY